jgi:DNA-directed RNA polymerase subunit RPC12/RpoP
MVKFKCENCGKEFAEHIQESWHTMYTRCPECGSKYIEEIGPGLPTVEAKTTTGDKE